MKRKRHCPIARQPDSPTEVIGKLREAEKLLSEGKATAEVARTLGVSEHTSRRSRKPAGSSGPWRQEYNHYRPHSSPGGMTPVEFADRFRGQKLRPAHQVPASARVTELAKRMDSFSGAGHHRRWLPD